MRWFDVVLIKAQTLFGRRRATTHLDDELRFYLERQVAENLAAGMSPEEARSAAMREFGNPALVRDHARATWNWAWLESLLHDVRYSIRTLRRTPGFAAIAILVIALGIGANVALFTVVRNILLKPLPYHDPDRLVSIYEHDSGGNHPEWSPYLPVDSGSMKEWQQAAQGLAEMAFRLRGRVTTSPPRAAGCRKRSMHRGARGISFPRLECSRFWGARFRPMTTGPARAPRFCSAFHLGNAGMAAIRPSWARPSGSMPGPIPSLAFCPNPFLF